MAAVFRRRGQKNSLHLSCLGVCLRYIRHTGCLNPPITNKGLFHQDRILELRIGNLYFLKVEDDEEILTYMHFSLERVTMQCFFLLGLLSKIYVPTKA